MREKTTTMEVIGAHQLFGDRNSSEYLLLCSGEEKKLIEV